MTPPLDPATDLHLARRFRADPARVWRCLTEADLLRRWFVPAPWTMAEVEIDPVPGGTFRTVMRDPDGAEMPMPPGCVLLAEPPRRLVWTSALSTGFVPVPPPEAGAFVFTADIHLTDAAPGTAYEVTLRHARREDAAAHAAMGFDAGWGTAADQLGALAATL